MLRRKTTMRISGVLAILTAATLWGLIGPLAKYAFAHGFTPLEVAFWRATLAWGFFALHAGGRGQLRIRLRDLGPTLVFGFFSVSVFFGSYQVAVARSGAAVAAVLLYTAPAWVALVSRIVFSEPLTRPKLISIALSCLGVAAVAFGRADLGPVRLDGLGLLAGLTAGLTYAIYYIFGKKYLGNYDAATLFFYALPVGTLTLWPLTDFSHHPVSAWLAVVGIGFFSTYVAYAVYCYGLQRLQPARAAVLATFEPVVAAVLAMTWWGERFTLLGVLGGVAIITGVLWMSWTTDPTTGE